MMMSKRELPPTPALMDESQYFDYAGSPPQNDPLAMTLVDINAKLEGIGRLEKNLAQIKTDFHGELDVIKMELANLTDARNKDSAEIRLPSKGSRRIYTKPKRVRKTSKRSWRN